jgi:predicted choloylglycine hydrolase
MKCTHTALPCLLALALALCPPEGRAETPAFHYPAASYSPARKAGPGKAGKTARTAELKIVNGIPVLRVAGSPEEMGQAVGVLALKPARRVLQYPREMLQRLRGNFLWGTLTFTGKGMFHSFPDDHKKELEALVRAAGVDRDLVIAGNTFFDLAKMFACSAVAVQKEKSATGGPLLARNLDYPSLGYVHQYSLVTVYRPEGKLAFASVGFPGLVGVLSGMNEAGLALAVLEVPEAKGKQQDYDVKGVPYALCLRRVLEQARTIDEAQKVLEGFRRTTAINVALADRRGAAVLEVTPLKVVRRGPADGVCAATNHFLSAALRPEKVSDLDDTLGRYARLSQVRTWKEKATPQMLQKKLDTVNLGTLTLQTMVFEPETLRLHLAIGKPPASKLPLRTLELADLLRPARK